MKLLFAGTPEIAATVLQGLIHSSHEILAVYTQPDRPAGRGRKLTPSSTKQLALQHNIPIEQPLNFKNQQDVDNLKNYQADAMIVTAYGLLLPLTILQAPLHGCINVHVSLLPRWRGASPIQQAILAGDKTTGISIMQMDTGLDTGPIYCQEQCAITSTQSAQQLHDHLAQIAIDPLLETLDNISNSVVIPTPQDESLVTYAHKIQKSDALIDWNKTAIDIQRQVYAYNPWPVAYTTIGDTRIRIWQGVAVKNNDKHPVGSIISADKNGIIIKTSNDAFCITELQLPGKKAMTCANVLNAHRDLLTPGTQC